MTSFYKFLTVLIGIIIITTVGTKRALAETTVTLTGVPTITGTAGFTVRFIFSEDITTTFTNSDIEDALVNATSSSFTELSPGEIYTALITPDGNGDVTLGLLAGAVTSVDGDNTAFSSDIPYDGDAPSVTITGLPSLTGPATTFDATYTFSEDVTGFSSADVTAGLTNATVSGFTTISASEYAVTISPDGVGDVSIGLPAGVVTDSAGNNNTTATNDTVPIDATRPSVSISGVPSTTDGVTPFTVTYTFSEEVTGFTKADVSSGLTNATATGSLTEVTSGTVFEIEVTPDSAADVIVELNSSVAFDVVENGNFSAADQTATFDASTVKPTLTVTGFPLTITGVTPFTATFTFSETVTGFSADTIRDNITNATVSNFTIVTVGQVFTADIASNRGGDTIKFRLIEGEVMDADGNTNDASSGYDTDYLEDRLPNVTITGVPATTDGSTAFTANYKFDIEVDNFDISDVTNGLTNATASDFVAATSDGKVFTALITPDGGGDVSVYLMAGAVTNIESDPTTTDSAIHTATLTTTIDSTAPTVSITADVDSFSGTTPFTATFSFSEGITGFELSDITVANGVASGLTGSGDTYTATIIPSDTGNITIDLAADAVTDGSGNGNIAAEQLVIRSAVVKQTQDRIVQGMQSRANQLISNQTTLFEFLQGGRGGFFNAEGSEAAGYFNLSSKHKGFFWFDVKGSWSREASSKTKYGHGTFGSHFEINQNVLLGAMVQFDVAENSDANSSLKSEGWLIGPYAVARHPNQDLYFEAAILYGQTQNRIKPFNTYEDTFKTDRWLFRGAVTGEVVFEDLSLFPNLKLTHTTDRQRAYIDSLSNEISEQSISLTELSAGIDFNRPIAIDGGEIALVGGISGIWSGSSGEGGSANDIVPDYDGGRAKVHLGMNFKDDNGLGASLSGFYDGIGANDYYAYGASITLKKQF
jgi:hypothetical protein